jgi:ribosomal-protein-alanine N-acetyltransferase
VIVIRPAGPADLDDVSSLERAAFGSDAWSPRSLEHELSALGDHRHMLVAVAADQVVGYAAAAGNGETCDLLRMAVAADHQRMGVASRLFTELFLGGRHRYERILLEVAADNSAALALYENLGFTEIARRPRYYSGAVAAVVMQLDLSAAVAQPERDPSARSRRRSSPRDRVRPASGHGCGHR